MTQIVLTSSSTWSATITCSGIQIECWGGGGAGASNNSLTTGAGGGGGGSYAITTANITQGTGYVVHIGAGGTSGSSPVNGGNTYWVATSTCNAPGGISAAYNSATHGNGGGAGVPSGTSHTGGTGWTPTSTAGGGGGGSGGPSNNGNSATTQTGAAAVTGGGAGGNGGNNGAVGNAPGAGYGGGGGGGGHGVEAGGAGYQGKIILTYFTLTYNGNGNTGGSVPAAVNAGPNNGWSIANNNTGQLVKTGYIMTGWNTAADGSGTHYVPGCSSRASSADVTLYAEWTAVTIPYTFVNGTMSYGMPVTGGGGYYYWIPSITQTCSIKAWGAGGRGTQEFSSGTAQGGGGGGAFATVPTYTFTAGTTYAIIVGFGNAYPSQSTVYQGVTKICVADGGVTQPADSGTGTGGLVANCYPTAGAYAGGNGADSPDGLLGGGGGGCAGSGGAGGNATGTTGGAGGTGTITGGAGGNGQLNGGFPGGGGGGDDSVDSGRGFGQFGQIIIAKANTITNFIWMKMI